MIQDVILPFLRPPRRSFQRHTVRIREAIKLRSIPDGNSDPVDSSFSRRFSIPYDMITLVWLWLMGRGSRSALIWRTLGRIFPACALVSLQKCPLDSAALWPEGQSNYKTASLTYRQSFHHKHSCGALPWVWHWSRYYRGPWLLRSIERSGIYSSNRSKWSCVRQPGSRGCTAPKTSKKSVLCVLHTCLHVYMKEWQSVRAWQYDVFYLLWISVIFCPAGVSHKASHGPKADSHWHWWTSWQIHFLAQIYHQSHTVLELSPPSATVHARLHIRYIKRAASLRSSRPLSHTHTHACSHATAVKPQPRRCVLCTREVVLGGRVGLSFPYADTVLHCTHCARKQQKDNDILYWRL